MQFLIKLLTLELPCWHYMQQVRAKKGQTTLSYSSGVTRVKGLCALYRVPEQACYLGVHAINIVETVKKRKDLLSLGPDPAES